MNIRIFANGVAASLALAAPAMAFDRNGTAHFDTRFGEVTSTFQQSYEPADRAFSRTGQIVLRGGRTLTYALSGSCAEPPANCDFTASATGPLGGKWRAAGSLTREADGVHLVGELTTPEGKSIPFDRLAELRRWFRQRPAHSPDAM